jgi:large subunit ribosomal protein L1
MAIEKKINSKGGKKIRSARTAVSDKLYNIVEAVEFVKTNAFAKFDETVELSLNLGIDPRHADQVVRGIVSMPNGTGKKVSVAVFAKDKKAEEAKEVGADRVGAEDLVDEIVSGQVNYDCYIATPDMMGVVGKVAKILGPKGLMPNPKLGTVTANVKEAVVERKSGQVEFRAEKAGIVHVGIGKISFAENKLVENIKALVDAIVKARPAGAKGTYLKSVNICSTMGASVRVDIQSLTA